MSKKIDTETAVNSASGIVVDAGGKIVGRTRFQKIACLLELAGVGDGFTFAYKHYGPFSDELANAAQLASLFGDLHEEERSTTWGGRYSIYTTDKQSKLAADSPRRRLINLGVEADPIELELAVTAAFLARSSDNEDDPWEQTELLKAEKSREGRLEHAKVLYAKFLQIDTPNKLPPIV